MRNIKQTLKTLKTMLIRRRERARAPDQSVSGIGQTKSRGKIRKRPWALSHQRFTSKNNSSHPHANFYYFYHDALLRLNLILILNAFLGFYLAYYSREQCTLVSFISLCASVVELTTVYLHSFTRISGSDYICITHLRQSNKSMID
jgi:hypothetical protein